MASELALLGGRKHFTAAPPHFQWPRISDTIRSAVLRQLDESISLYGASGIFERFEAKFAAYHGRKHALLCSSGTAALLSMYFGAGLLPGDEVICPVYTFPATVTPLVMLGVTPVFCDSDATGNMAVSAVRDLVTDRTKAVVITHLWGIPCEMSGISAVAREFGLAIFEDCSHAHGSRLRGRLVGTFGRAAAWSFQAQKTVAGGEGGILLTDDDELFYRALLLGHYNKRCRESIPETHFLHRFALTGFGLKLRAHPLAIAIAEQLFDDLDTLLDNRSQHAAVFHDVLAATPSLAFPDVSDRRVSGYTFPMIVASEVFEAVGPEILLEALHAEGLVEIDRPGSTKPLHEEPLFNEPNHAFPWARASVVQQGGFPIATDSFRRTIKMPVWDRQADRAYTDGYASGVRKVFQHLEDLK